MQSKRVMDEPVDYGEMSRHLHETCGSPMVGIKTPYHSTWLDNEAKFLLAGRPEYDLKTMLEAAFKYVRAQEDPRKDWYPG